jgi:hypothetical protein
MTANPDSCSDIGLNTEPRVVSRSRDYGERQSSVTSSSYRDNGSRLGSDRSSQTTAPSSLQDMDYRSGRIPQSVRYGEVRERAGVYPVRERPAYPRSHVESRTIRGAPLSPNPEHQRGDTSGAEKHRAGDADPDPEPEPEPNPIPDWDTAPGLPEGDPRLQYRDPGPQYRDPGRRYRDERRR